MVESLLDFGRMEAGQRTYRMEDTDVGELARQVLDDFRDETPVAADRVALETPLDRHGDRVRATPRIQADREALALALRNLLDNAVKYSPESSPVRVSVESLDGFATLSVTDCGPGVPTEEQRKVFRKFVRGTAATTLNVKGTGIGLAMATTSCGRMADGSS
jgi:signal transduction histidine kinase